MAGAAGPDPDQLSVGFSGWRASHTLRPPLLLAVVVEPHYHSVFVAEPAQPARARARRQPGRPAHHGVSHGQAFQPLPVELPATLTRPLLGPRGRAHARRLRHVRTLTHHTNMSACRHAATHCFVCAVCALARWDDAGHTTLLHAGWIRMCLCSSSRRPGRPTRQAAVLVSRRRHSRVWWCDPTRVCAPPTSSCPWRLSRAHSVPTCVRCPGLACAGAAAATATRGSSKLSVTIPSASAAASSNGHGHLLETPVDFQTPSFEAMGCFDVASLLNPSGGPHNPPPSTTASDLPMLSPYGASPGESRLCAPPLTAARRHRWCRPVLKAALQRAQ